MPSSGTGGDFRPATSAGSSPGCAHFWMRETNGQQPLFVPLPAILETSGNLYMFRTAAVSILSETMMIMGHARSAL